MQRELELRQGRQDGGRECSMVRPDKKVHSRFGAVMPPLVVRRHYKYEEDITSTWGFLAECILEPDHRVMQTLREAFYGSVFYGTGECHCYDNQYRPTHHGTEQRYISPTSGKCKPLIVQAVHPRSKDVDRIEISVGENTPKARKLATWLVLNLPMRLEQIPLWLMRWTWFTLALIWPFTVPKYTGFYPTYLSRYYGQLWVARSPREYSLRRAQLGVERVHAITHSTHPRRLVIYDPASRSWQICSDPNVVRQQKYIAISYRYEEIVPKGTSDENRTILKATFITDVEAVVASLHLSAYWIDLTLIDKSTDASPAEVDQDVYRMADVYRGAEFTLIMLCPPDGVTEEGAWLAYGERLWTFPEALLSRELRFKFRGEEVTPITLHQLANRAYAGFAEESAVINAYGLRDSLERLERLSLLRSALWRRTSGNLERLEEKNAEQYFRAERVYALMGFFEHRIHPHFQETELQALVRLSMANDNDRIVERMVSLLPSVLPDNACWYAEEDRWGANLWDIEPEVQVVGMTQKESIVLGGCRAATIRWKDFPSVAFAMRRSYTRLIASYLPNLFWEFLFFGIGVESVASQFPLDQAYSGAWVPLVIAILLMLFAPLLVAYGASGRIVQAQPWLVGVKGLVSAEEASTLMYGGAIMALPRTFYSACGTLLSQTETGQFRRGDPAQLDALKPQRWSAGEDDDLYTLIDTVSATIYYFRAARPPTVCLYTGREGGMGRFVLCSERCTVNELHKETVIRMPWYLSQSMRACDWVALG
ncbi:hypothetical protein L210DRAFT_2192850 [Boletus edulis BED1]|uniref:Uncharacterized protein n=1 Tax=Boletus edulis BED1 TaxID=1328754 RepID=A0AAD4BUI7_BOLED|nr:hypothetical protein L210DRAFT_2192850 [Boletus edulis BED1]